MLVIHCRVEYFLFWRSAYSYIEAPSAFPPGLVIHGAFHTGISFNYCSHSCGGYNKGIGYLPLLLYERRGSAVVSTSACHAGGPGSRLVPGTLLGVKTCLSTLEIVYLCVFRMRH